jgi:organic hydroperoxide reductase OsmC/OhrA
MFAGCFNHTLSTIIEQKKKELNKSRYEQHRTKKRARYQQKKGIKTEVSAPGGSIADSSLVETCFNHFASLCQS